MEITYKVWWVPENNVFVVQVTIDGRPNEMTVVAQLAGPLTDDPTALAEICQSITDHVERYVKESSPGSKVTVTDDENPISEMDKMIQKAFEKLDPDTEPKN